MSTPDRQKVWRCGLCPFI